MNDDGALAACLELSVPGLRAAVLFGSTLSSTTRRPGSIPDVFALVDDLDEALARFGVPAWARRLARGLSPATIALGEELTSGPIIAKLNLATPGQVKEALARLRDLSLAGRLAKKTRSLVHRNAETRAEMTTLLDAAAGAMARTATLGLPRHLPLEEACRRCFALSYRAELRPERPAQIDARFEAFAADYRASYQQRLITAAQARGIQLMDGALIDRRPTSVRRHEAWQLSRLLWRGRLRALARWGRQPLLYRGWFPYLVGKLRRAWA
jgi:hypothetical protein